MAIEFNGRAVETTSTGFLVDVEDWSPDLGRQMAELEGIALTDAHWDILNHLREEYFDNNGSQPNTRGILKAMTEKWGRAVTQKELYDLFPGDPSKQAGRIAGLPESKRKGGY